MDALEFLKGLGIDKPAVNVGETGYKMTLEDSNEFARVYSKLDKSELTDLDQSVSYTNESGSELFFMSADYDITLKADFDKDSYELIIKEGDI